MDIKCAACGCQVEKIETFNDVKNMQTIIRVSCHGERQEMRLDDLSDMSKEIRGGKLAGVAFEPKQKAIE